MAKNNNLTDFLTDIATTIRNTDGTATTPLTDANKINPQDFSTRIVNYQNKTVTPSTSQQSVTRDNGYMALGTVTINAMPGGTATVQDKTSGGTAVGYGKEVNLTAGYYSAQKFYNSIEAGTIDVTDLTITPNALSGSWDSTNNKYVVSQASKTATMQSTVTTAGYVSSSVGTKNTGTATVSAPSNLEIPKATFEVSGASVKTTSSGAGYIPASTTVGTIGSGSATGNAGTITYVSHTQDSSNKKKFTVTGSVTAPAPTISAGYISSGSAGTATNRTVSLTITDAQAQAAVGVGSATTPATTIKTNPTLSTTYTTDKGYLLSVSATQNVTPTVVAGYVASGTAGTITVQNADTPAYVAQNSFAAGTAPSGTTPTSLAKNTTYKLSAGYYPSDRYYKTQADPTLSGDAETSNVLSGKTFYSNSYTKQTGTMTNNGAVSKTLDTSTTSYTVLAGYHNGSGTVSITLEEKAASGSGDIIPTSGKVLSKVTVGAGTATPNASYATLSSAGTSPTSVTSQYFKITPTASVGTVGWISSIGNGTVQNYTVRSAATFTMTGSAVTDEVSVGSVSSGYYPISAKVKGTVAAGTSGWFSSSGAVQAGTATQVGKIAAGTITNNTSGGTSSGTIDAGSQIKIGKGYYSADVYYQAAAETTLSGDAVEANVLSGKTFYSNSYTKKTGSMTNNGAISATKNPTFSGATASYTYTIPAGYHNGSGTVSGSATMSNATLGVNSPSITPSISSTYTSGSGYAITGSATTTASVSGAGYASTSATASGTASISGYVAQNSFATGTAPSGTTPTNLTAGSVYKLSSGYYPTDRYYKVPDAPSGNIQLTQSTSTNIAAYATATVRTATATASATVSGSSSALSSPTAMNNQYFTVTPSYSLDTSGWVNAGNVGTTGNYKVRDGSATPSASYATLSSAGSSATSVTSQYFKITPTASVGTAGWISSISNGTVQNYTIRSVSGTSSMTKSSDITWSTSDNSGCGLDLIPKYTVSTSGWASGTYTGTTYYLDGVDIQNGTFNVSSGMNGGVGLDSNGTVTLYTGSDSTTTWGYNYGNVTINSNQGTITSEYDSGTIKIFTDGGYYEIADANVSGTANVPTVKYDGINQQILIADDSADPAYINVANAYGYLDVCNLPNIKSSSSVGTAVATITQGTTTQYLNIPAGYHARAEYYTISGLATQTLPSSTSSSSSGTYKTSITPSNSSQYLNIPSGYQSTSQYYTISAIPQVKVQSRQTLSTSSSSYRYLWCNSSVAACYAFKNQSGAGNYQKAGSLSAGTNTWVGDCSNSTSYRNSMLFVGGQFTSSSTINITWSSSTSSSTTTGSYTYTPTATCYGIIFKIYRNTTSQMYVWPIELRTGTS